MARTSAALERELGALRGERERARGKFSKAARRHEDETTARDDEIDSLCGVLGEVREANSRLIAELDDGRASAEAMARRVAEASARASSLGAGETRLTEELREQRAAFDRQLKDFEEAEEANSELAAELRNV